MEFSAYLSEYGINADPILDGEVHRFKGPGDKNNDSWYIGSLVSTSKEVIPTLTNGNWRTGMKSTYRSNKINELSSEDLKTLEEKQKEHAERAAKNLAERRALAQAEAKRLWAMASSDGVETHPYVVRKKIKPKRARVLDGALLIPSFDEASNMWGLQRIYPDGGKFFLSGQKVKGTSHVLFGKSDEFVYLCEGYATGCTINELTGVTTFVAFDCGNLLAVADTIRANGYPGKIIVCADNDCWKEGGNPGVEAGTAVLGQIENCQMLIPAFKNKEATPTDFNDLFVLEGEDEAKRQLGKIISESRQGNVGSGNGYTNHCTAEDKEQEGFQPNDNQGSADSSGSGSGEFEKANETERENAKPKSKEKQKNPHQIAEEFLKGAGFVDKNGECLLKFYRGDFYRYKKNHFQLIDDDWFDNKLNSWLAKNGYGKIAGSYSVQAVINMIKTSPRFVGSQVELPAVMEDDDWISAKHLIPLKNGLLDAKHYCRTGEIKLIPHSPRVFSTYILDFEFKEDATCPIFDKICLDIFENQEQIDAIFEYYGIHFYTPFLIELMFILCGIGANGKSVLLTILNCLLGEDNISTVGIENFNSNNFSFINSLGKLANVVPDMHDISDIDEGVLKQFISREPMLFNRKFKPAVKAKPTAFLTISTNTLPRFTDKTDGIFRRVWLMDMNRQIPEEKRNPLYREERFWKESGELPGIFLKAMQGLSRVVKRGFIKKTASMQKAVQEYRAELNPIMGFYEDCIEKLEGHYQPTPPVYEQYKTYCSKNGFKTMSSITFTKHLKMELVKQGISQPLSEENMRIGQYSGRVWKGVRLVESKGNFTSNVDGGWERYS